MFDTLPGHHEAAWDWTWENYKPYFENLMAREITPVTLPQYMRDFSNFEALLYDVYVRLEVQATRNTADAEVEKRYAAFLDQVFPPMLGAINDLRKKLVASGLQPEDFTVPIRNWRAQIDTFREANQPLIAEDNRIGTEYDKITGAQTVEWEGETVTLTRLLPVLQNPDRSLREKVWRLSAARVLQDREAIGHVWVKLLEIRQQIGANAGMDYLSWIWQQKTRFDYSPQDCLHFHDAVEQTVTPALERLYVKRRQQLGVDTLRPWDLDVDPQNLPALKPFETAQELTEKSSTVFHKVDPVLGGYFDYMRDHDLLDLENRPHKAPGGYMTSFLIDRHPFIFMNAVGVQRDLETIMHEGGHAFHGFESRHLPYVQQTETPNEFGELAAMAMELLSAPYWTQFYQPVDAARARSKHLEGILRIWVSVAVNDAFQHWIYTHWEEAKDLDACDSKFVELRNRFFKGIDWSGLAAEHAGQWYRVPHFFKFPLYYIEYGLAQLGAVQVWANALTDQRQAVADYRKALSYGGTRSVPELFEAAGAKFAFDVATFQSAVNLIEKTMTALETHRLEKSESD